MYLVIFLLIALNADGDQGINSNIKCTTTFSKFKNSISLPVQ